MPSPGDIILSTDVGTAISSLPTGIVARGLRTTGSSATTSEVGVLRLDGVTLLAGRQYRISTSGLIFNSTVANDLIEAKVRVNTAGTATTGSTHHASIVDTAHSASGAQKVTPLNCWYRPGGANQTVSILLSIARSAGTGSVSIPVPTSAYNIELVVTDEGVDPGDAGVSV